MAGLRDPIVSPRVQAANAVGHRDGRGDDHERQSGQGPGRHLEVVHSRQSGVDDQGVQLERRQVLGHGGVAEHLALPPQGGETPVEHREKTAVVVDQRKADDDRLRDDDEPCRVPRGMVEAQCSELPDALPSAVARVWVISGNT